MAEEIMSKETMTMSTQNMGATVAPRLRRALRAFLVLAIGVAAMAQIAIPAQAEQKVTSFTVGTSSSKAGGHPDLTASFSLEDPGEPEAAKNVAVNLPEGVFGNPGAILKCSGAEFVVNECSPGSQAGFITVYANHSGNPNFLLGTAPVYNMQSVSPDEAARLAFVAPTVGVPVSIPVSVRTGSDYGLRMTVAGIPQVIPVSHIDIIVWGLPALPEHDGQRFHLGAPGVPAGCPGLADTSCIPGPTQAGEIPRPYIDNPSVCTGKLLPVTIEVETYQDASHPSHGASSYPPTESCEKQNFEPVFNMGLTTNETDAPTGMDLQLKADQFLGPAPAPSELRTASLTLPPGLTINPDAADGQTACSDAQANFGNDRPGNCPDSSKIGTVEVHTPALDGPLVGSLYFGEPKPGNQYRVFMIFDGFGIHAKLFAAAFPDPQTGQVTMSITDLPQVPFEEFDLHLFASDRGLMATPIRCTLNQASAYFVPWNDLLSPQRSDPNFGLSSGPHKTQCPGTKRPFKPRLVAGASNPVAGAFSSFTLRLDRDDGDQFLGDLNFKMPPGFTGSLRGISYCPEGAIAAAAQNPGRAELANPSCPASSQIGTTNVAAGPGEHPFHAFGKMYLSGPLKGAPLSLAAITPALAGPYDYGTVVVRVALHVDSLDAHVFAASDTVPSIIGGVPIRMRSIQVNIDKDRFTINPTNCSPFTVDSQGIGDEATVTDFSSYFQAVNCSRLPFKPTMTMRQLGGRKGTRRAVNPGLQIDLRTRPGDANIKSISVTLSSAFEIDQRHLGNICSEKELTEKQCAGRTPIGQATTTTPLLDQPLTGPVYAVSGSGGLPRLALILNGQVNLVPRADTKSVGGGRLQTTVPVVPDAPIGHFSLKVFGGKAGYLINTRDICAHRPATRVAYTGQNGKTRTQAIRVKAACGGKKARG
jgi:hypothetical protein